MQINRKDKYIEKTNNNPYDVCIKCGHQRHLITNGVCTAMVHDKETSSGHRCNCEFKF